MANWNKLFEDEANIERIPEADVLKYAFQLEERFNTEKAKDIKVWDIGCGGGGHSVALSRMGFNMFCSDNSLQAIELTKNWLSQLSLSANVEISSMEECPWNEKFQGIFSWNTLNHNTSDKIKSTVDMIYTQLVDDGLFLAILKSDKADMYGKGKAIEPKTF